MLIVAFFSLSRSKFTFSQQKIQICSILQRTLSFLMAFEIVSQIRFLFCIFFLSCTVSEM